MPELPEVETVRQILRKKVIGKTIQSLDILYEGIIQQPVPDFKKQLLGQTILEVERIGKYLLFQWEDVYLISHLRMEGKYSLRKQGLPRDKHDHVIFLFTDGTELRYNDVRKFGTMELKNPNELYEGKPLGKLGYEPFHPKFTLEYMKQKFKRKTAIKNVLLDQTVIAGLGNIYVNEVLFICGIHPSQRAETLTDQDLLNIKEASIKVLNRAIELGGTTIRSYYADDDITGLFQNELLVHEQKDQPCPTCETTIEKIKVGGRGTYLCPTCQILK